MSKISVDSRKCLHSDDINFKDKQVCIKEQTDENMFPRSATGQQVTFTTPPVSEYPLSEGRVGYKIAKRDEIRSLESLIVKYEAL